MDGFNPGLGHKGDGSRSRFCRRQWWLRRQESLLDSIMHPSTRVHCKLNWCFQKWPFWYFHYKINTGSGEINSLGFLCTTKPSPVSHFLKKMFTRYATITGQGETPGCLWKRSSAPVTGAVCTWGDQSGVCRLRCGRAQQHGAPCVSPLLPSASLVWQHQEAYVTESMHSTLLLPRWHTAKLQRSCSHHMTEELARKADLAHIFSRAERGRQKIAAQKSSQSKQLLDVWYRF